MIENAPEDVLHGAFAVFTAWGWAKAEIVELDPGKRMVVRAYDSSKPIAPSSARVASQAHTWFAAFLFPLSWILLMAAHTIRPVRLV